MDIVKRLLTREEIDSLELDLARAREAGDAEQVSALSARIGQLEMAMATARRSDDQTCAAMPDHAQRRAA